MKVQMAILGFMVCLNLSVWLANTTSLPSSTYMMADMPVNASEYEAHFNATEIADRWTGPTIITGIPIIGDIFSGLYFALQNIIYLIDGFPQFLQWIGYTYTFDAGGQVAWVAIQTVYRAIFAIMVSLAVIEFISGRYFTT